MDDFTAHILRSLVEGHEARAGMKERNRALTEYEIARRAGYTSFSYVEFSTTQEREQVRGALAELEREGWITQWQRAGRYDTFVPTELGVRRAATLDGVRESPPTDLLDAFGSPPQAATVASAWEGAPQALALKATLTRLVQQLDEVVGLLRSIDSKLGRDR